MKKDKWTISWFNTACFSCAQSLCHARWLSTSWFACPNLSFLWIKLYSHNKNIHTINKNVNILILTQLFCGSPFDAIYYCYYILKKYCQMLVSSLSTTIKRLFSARLIRKSMGWSYGDKEPIWATHLGSSKVSVCQFCSLLFV